MFTVHMGKNRFGETFLFNMEFWTFHTTGTAKKIARFYPDFPCIVITSRTDSWVVGDISTLQLPTHAPTRAWNPNCWSLRCKCLQHNSLTGTFPQTVLYINCWISYLLMWQQNHFWCHISKSLNSLCKQIKYQTVLRKTKL